jgi:hypothetical protein
MPKPIIAGDQFKIKATPITRKYGVSVGGAWRAKGDDAAWPGEIGTVERSEWQGGNHTMHAYWLVFSRGRQIAMEGRDHQIECLDAEPVALRHPEDFVRVTVRKSNPSSLNSPPVHVTA